MSEGKEADLGVEWHDSPQLSLPPAPLPSLGLSIAILELRPWTWSSLLSK